LACGVLGALAALAGGCAADRELGLVPNGSESSDGSSDSSSSSSSTTSAESSGAASSSTSDGSTSTGEPEAGLDPDREGCSTYVQDCDSGWKCMPWSNDGSFTWNSTKCFPISESPVGVNGECHVEGNGVSGIDDCDVGLMCWDVDPETNTGVCVPLCVGSERAPACEDPDLHCAFTRSAASVCLPYCDPLGDDCAPCEGCYPLQDEWGCAPDASGDLGAYGDPCEYINVCDDGLICLNASAVPPGLPCEGAAGCCTQVCDITDPAGDQQCAGVAEGQTCQSWYEEGHAPVGFEHVGACALPA
jgi:hypothetical protein